MANSTSNGINPDSSSKVSNSASLFSKLPGLSASDSNALIGRNRLAQALELEDPQDNLFVKRSLYVLGAAALIFFPWAALTPITQVIEASGEVIPQGSVNIIQHLEGGIVSSVNVKNGQSVSKGEALLQLNPQMVGSEFSATKTKLDALIIQQQQLRAAIRGDGVLPGKNNINGLNQNESKISVAQQNLLTSRLENASDQLKSANAVVAEKSAEINGLNKQLKLLIEERDMWASLTKDGASSRLQLVNAQAKVEEIRGNAGSKAKVASRARFGALLPDFWPLVRALSPPLGCPEALLGRFGAALGGQKVKNGVWPKLPVGFWSPKPSREAKKDLLRGNFLWISMIFEGFTRQKCDSSKTCLKKHNFYLHKSHVRCLLCR